ncbi:MGMT family protein [Luteimonas sp. RIT-PG2_3]
MSDLSAQKRILAAIRAIPKGAVAGYGDVARRAGLSGRARMVARLLSQNEDASLPWHRVLRSDGRIAFAQGSPQFLEQAARLAREGVKVENGRVRISRGDDSLDAMLWGPADGMR